MRVNERKCLVQLGLTPVGREEEKEGMITGLVLLTITSLKPVGCDDECSGTSHVKLTCVASRRHHPHKSLPTHPSIPLWLCFHKGHARPERVAEPQRWSNTDACVGRRRVGAMKFPSCPSPAGSAPRLVALRKGRSVKSRRRARAGNPEVWW
jgi:hypothetical protein